MPREVVQTRNAPAAIGPYSQAVRTGNTVWLSGQIPLDPQTMELVSGTREQIEQVLRNLSAVAAAVGGSLDDVVKLTVYLVDLGDLATVNEVMATHLAVPFPARAAVQVAALPKGARVEIDGVLVLPD